MRNKDAPPKVQPSLTARPKVRQMYWCKFPLDAQLPEFWKTRPVIIVSHNNSLYGAVTVIACSTKEQKFNRWAYELSNTIDGQRAWAICDKPTTVAVSRLTRDKHGINRVTNDDFDKMLHLMLTWLPKPTSSA